MNWDLVYAAETRGIDWGHVDDFKLTFKFDPDWALGQELY
jgi:hypothetical protein